MFTKQHYERIANILKVYHDNILKGCVYEPNELLLCLMFSFAGEFQNNNPRFDRKRFLSACGIEMSS